MSLDDSCRARLVRPSLAYPCALLLAISVFLFVAATASAFADTTGSARVWQKTLPQSRSVTSAPRALLAVQQAELSDRGAATYDEFGYSVVLSGDTALVGAPYKTIAGRYQAGAAYVFTRTGKIWSQQARLAAPDGAAGDGFGTSVALSGDTALIGAPYRTVAGQIAAGAAYVFSGAGTSWSQQAELSVPDAAFEDEFGTSVALSGDTALVGAPNKTVAGRYQAGAVYMFTRTGTTWPQQTELAASDVAPHDGFGWSVALSGDTALVGAPFRSVGAAGEAGVAYIFRGSGTSWSQRAELSDSDVAADDCFGTAMALSGKAVLIGAPGKTVAGRYQAGAVYMFTRTGTTWPQQTELAASDGAAGDNFGFSVALSGGTALVGADGKTVSGRVGAGVAYVFRGPGTSWPQQAELSDPHAALEDEFGWSVALSGDTALVGADIKTVGGHTAAGAAYVDVLSSTLAPKITSFTPTSGPVGTLVTLTGTNFTGATKVAFHGTAATSFHVVSAKTIRANVPACASTGTIAVTTLGGTAASAASFTVTVVVTPKLTLKLSGLTSDAVMLGKSVTARGTVTPTSLAGSKVKLTVQEKQAGKWVKVQSVARTIGATRAYSWKYKPAEKGSYRIEATIAETATHTAATTACRTFKVE